MMDNKRVEELRLAYRRTFNTDDGQRVLDDLMKRFSGQRAAVLLIVRMLSEEKERQ